MKNLRIVCAASILMLGFSVMASAGDRQVSKAKLDKMGLGNMERLSDEDGTHVRGKGNIRDIINDIKDLIRDLSHLTIGVHHHHHHM